ncbi:hypothetical protein ECG_03009 [Echinococcus granulosus]|nr:hypothetical protein ECG_03009 [Echinococcus granulosus]
MPIKLRGRTKYKPSEDSGQGEGNNHPDCVKPQKSKTLLWRLFSSSRRSVDNTSPASQPGDIPSCVYESGAILEEEYQESFGMTAEHSESVPSILRKITPPRLSDPPPGGGATPTRHSAYVTSRGHRFATAAAAAIYNEPCDARRAGSSSGGSASTFKRTALRRASLAASIYCDTEHHRQDVFQPPSSPQGSPDSLQPTSSNHLWEGSGSAGFTVTNGWKNGVTSHMSQHWKEHDSGSSSLSNSRDIFSHTNPCLDKKTDCILRQVPMS